MQALTDAGTRVDAILYGTGAPIGAEVYKEGRNLFIRWPQIMHIDGAPIGFEMRFRIVNTHGPAMLPDLCTAVDLKDAEESRVISSTQPDRTGQRWLSDKECQLAGIGDEIQGLLRTIAAEYAPEKAAKEAFFDATGTLHVYTEREEITIRLLSRMCANVVISQRQFDFGSKLASIVKLIGNSMEEFKERAHKVSYRTSLKGEVSRRSFEGLETDTWTTLWSGTELQ